MNCADVAGIPIPSNSVRDASNTCSAAPTRSITLWVAPLNDEPGLHAVELKAIVKPGIREFHERGRMKRCVVGKEAEDDIAVRGRDSHL